MITRTRKWMCTRNQYREIHARLIQRRVRTWLTRDPLSLERIRTPFRLMRNGVWILYDAHSLRSYIIASGDLSDPVTRTLLCPHELMRLDRATDQRSCFVLLSKLNQLQERRQELIQRASLCAALESEMSDRLSVVSALHDEDTAVESFTNNAIPLLVQCFENMIGVDSEACLHAIDGLMQSCIISKDMHPGLKQVVVNFLAMLHRVAKQQRANLLLST